MQKFQTTQTIWGAAPLCHMSAGSPSVAAVIRLKQYPSLVSLLSPPRDGCGLEYTVMNYGVSKPESIKPQRIDSAAK